MPGAQRCKLRGYVPRRPERHRCRDASKFLRLVLGECALPRHLCSAQKRARHSGFGPLLGKYLAEYAKAHKEDIKAIAQAGAKKAGKKFKEAVREEVDEYAKKFQAWAAEHHRTNPPSDVAAATYPPDSRRYQEDQSTVCDGVVCSNSKPCDVIKTQVGRVLVVKRICASDEKPRECPFKTPGSRHNGAPAWFSNQGKYKGVSNICINWFYAGDHVMDVQKSMTKEDFCSCCDACNPNSYGHGFMCGDCKKSTEEEEPPRPQPTETPAAGSSQPRECPFKTPGSRHNGAPTWFSTQAKHKGASNICIDWFYAGEYVMDVQKSMTKEDFCSCCAACNPNAHGHGFLCGDCQSTKDIDVKFTENPTQNRRKPTMKPTMKPTLQPTLPPTSPRPKKPYEIPLDRNWCGHPGAIHQNVPGCGRVCSDANGNRGVMKLRNWPRASCLSCPGAQWDGCPKVPTNSWEKFNNWAQGGFRRF